MTKLKRDNQVNGKINAHAKAWVFLCLAFLLLSTLPVMVLAKTESGIGSEDEGSKPGAGKLIEEMSKGEKHKLAQDLIKDADRYVEEKNYDQANAVYEQVFQLEPDNVTASQKIDALKKVMVKEGKTETGLLKSVYDDEADLRVKKYWDDVKRFTEERKPAQARFALQKILLIDPFNAEASKRYQEIQKTQSGEES